MKILYSYEWSDTSSGLAEKVNERLKFGWKLQGGIACAAISGSVRFFQAMYNDDFIENKALVCSTSITSES